MYRCDNQFHAKSFSEKNHEKIFDWIPNVFHYLKNKISNKNQQILWDCFSNTFSFFFPGQAGHAFSGLIHRNTGHIPGTQYHFVTSIQWKVLWIIQSHDTIKVFIRTVIWQRKGTILTNKTQMRACIFFTKPLKQFSKMQLINGSTENNWYTIDAWMRQILSNLRLATTNPMQ